MVVETEVENTGSEWAEGMLESLLLYEGKEVGRMRSRFAAGVGETAVIEQEAVIKSRSCGIRIRPGSIR